MGKNVCHDVDFFRALCLYCGSLLLHPECGSDKCYGQATYNTRHNRRINRTRLIVIVNVVTVLFMYIGMLLKHSTAILFFAQQEFSSMHIFSLRFFHLCALYLLICA